MANTAIRLGYLSISSGGGGGAGFEEYADLAAFPPVGEDGTIYLANDTKKLYVWTGSAYEEISPSEVTSVNTQTGDVLLYKADIGLGNVDNTSDANKPISTATQIALDDLDERIIPLEERDQVVTIYAYENNAQVYADAEPGIRDTSALIRDGWYFKNSVTGQKINWYFFDGLTQGVCTLGDFKSAYAIMTFDAVSSAATPIMAIYTVPTGTGDALPSFAHSRIIYDGVMTPTPVVGKQYLVYAGENPIVHPELPRINLALIPSLSVGEKLPTEQILTISFGSSSGAGVNQVQYMVETLGLFSDTVKQEMDLRIRTVPLNTSDKIDAIYLPSYVDDVVEYANLAAFPPTGETGKIYVALDTNKIYRWSGSAYIEISPSESATWGSITGTLSSQTDLQEALDDKYDASNPAGYITLAEVPESAVTSVNTRTGDVFLTRVDVGLGDVDNTSDLDKPISNDTQDALDLINGAIDLITDVNWTGDYNNGTTYAVGDGVMYNGASFRMINFIGAAGYAPPAYPGSWLQVTDYVSPNDIGLGNVDNTSDLDKPISTATQTALDDILDYTPADTSAWIAPVPDDVKEALDQLADRLDSGTGVTITAFEDMKEPTGFINRTDSTISFDDSTRIFTIAPVGSSFSFYIKGNKFTKTTAQTVTIPDTSGSHYIYFNTSGVLVSTQVFDISIIEQDAYVSLVYWNTDTIPHSRSYFAEERHGITMDGTTHAYLHTIFGARYLSGLALGGFTIGNGSLDSHAQFTSDSGSIRDEDILHTIGAQTQIPILFRQGQLWRKKAADNFPVIYSGSAGYTGANGRLPYNQYTGGAWQLTQVASNKFVLVHYFATNDVDSKVVGIQGIAEYNDVPAARNAASTEITTLSDLPFTEFVPIGTVIFQTNTYTNAIDARIVPTNGANYMDFRGTQLYTPAGEATEHSLLSGLADDDHIQYHTDARGDARYNLKSTGDISETSYSITNSQTSAHNITGFAFDNAIVRSFEAEVSVKIDADTDLFEKVSISGIHKSADWEISIRSLGDSTGIVFSITSAGQLQYTSLNYTGFVSGVIKFRAVITSV